MNYKKMFFILIWLLVIFIGAFTVDYISLNFKYIYGFLIGSISEAILLASKENK